MSTNDPPTAPGVAGAAGPGVTAPGGTAPSTEELAALEADLAALEADLADLEASDAGDDA